MKSLVRKVVTRYRDYTQPRGDGEGASIMYGSDEEVVLITEATALPGRGDDLRRAFLDLIPQSLAEGDVSTFRLH
jgi:hypothetical protein